MGTIASLQRSSVSVKATTEEPTTDFPIAKLRDLTQVQALVRRNCKTK